MSGNSSTIGTAPHGSLKGASPIDKMFDLSEKTPYWSEVYENFDSSKKGIQEQNYRVKLKFNRLKRCL